MVTVYTTTMCATCKAVKTYLTNKHIRFREINIDFSDNMAQKLWELGYRTTPVTQIGEEYVVGPNYSGINEAIKKNGG